MPINFTDLCCKSTDAVATEANAAPPGSNRRQRTPSPASRVGQPNDRKVDQASIFKTGASASTPKRMDEAARHRPSIVPGDFKKAAALNQRKVDSLVQAASSTSERGSDSGSRPVDITLMKKTLNALEETLLSAKVCDTRTKVASHRVKELGDLLEHTKEPTGIKAAAKRITSRQRPDSPTTAHFKKSNRESMERTKRLYESYGDLPSEVIPKSLRQSLSLCESLKDLSNGSVLSDLTSDHDTGSEEAAKLATEIEARVVKLQNDADGKELSEGIDAILELVKDLKTSIKADTPPAPSWAFSPDGGTLSDDSSIASAPGRIPTRSLQPPQGAAAAASRSAAEPYHSTTDESEASEQAIDDISVDSQSFEKKRTAKPPAPDRTP